MRPLDYTEVIMITVSEAKEFLDISSIEKDELLDMIITASSVIIQNYTGLTLTEQTAATLDIDGTGSSTLLLPNYLNSVTSVGVGARTADTISYTTYTSGYFTIRGGTLLKFLDSNYIFTAGVENIQVTGNWGFGTWEDDLLQAQKMLVAWLYQKNKEEISVSKRVYQDMETTFIQDIPRPILLLLDNYKARLL